MPKAVRGPSRAPLSEVDTGACAVGGEGLGPLGGELLNAPGEDTGRGSAQSPEAPTGLGGGVLDLWEGVVVARRTGEVELAVRISVEAKNLGRRNKNAA